MIGDQPSRNSLHQALGRFAEIKGLAASGHIPQDKLQEYVQDLLDETQSDVVSDHLALCPTCAERLLQLSCRVGPEEELTQADLDHDLGLLSVELGLAPSTRDHWILRELEPESVAQAPAARVSAFRGRGLHTALAAAASVLIVLNLALLLWPPGSSKPRGDVGPIRLMPDRPVRQHEDPQRAAVVLPTMLMLNTNEVYGYESFDATFDPVASDRGSEAVSVALEKQAFGNFAVLLPEGSLRPGEYSVLLRGYGGAEPAVLERYAIEIYDSADAQQVPQPQASSVP